MQAVFFIHSDKSPQGDFVLDVYNGGNYFKQVSSAGIFSLWHLLSIRYSFVLITFANESPRHYLKQ